MSALKNKFFPFEHDGVTYQVSFNMNVLDMLEDAYGSLERFIDIIRPAVPNIEENVEIEVEEGAAGIIAPEQERKTDTREAMRAYNHLMLAMINDAIEAGEYIVDPARTEPVEPYTIRSLQRSLSPNDYAKTSGYLMDIIIAAYPPEETGENSPKNC